MNKKDLDKFFTERGWHVKANSKAYYKEGVEGLRYKVGKLVLRKERRLENGTWYRLRSAYISALSINAEGKLSGMK